MSKAINTTLNWDQLNEKWESNGLLQAVFCKHNEINHTHFTYQRSKILKKQIYKKSIEFASVQFTSPAVSSEISTEIIIELPGRNEITHSVQPRFSL